MNEQPNKKFPTRQGQKSRAEGGRNPSAARESRALSPKGPNQPLGKKPNQQPRIKNTGASPNGKPKPKASRKDFKHRSTGGAKLAESVTDLVHRAESSDDVIHDQAAYIRDLESQLKDVPKNSVPECAYKTSLGELEQLATVETYEHSLLTVSLPDPGSPPPPTEGDPGDPATSEPADFDPLAHLSDKIKGFYWDESPTIDSFIPFGIFFFATAICTVLAVPWFITTPALSWLLRWALSRMPKRHAVVPEHIWYDHHDDRRPDAHKLLDLSHSSEYYFWKQTSGPLPVHWVWDSVPPLAKIITWCSAVYDDFVDFLQMIGLDPTLHFQYLSWFLLYHRATVRRTVSKYKKLFRLLHRVFGKRLSIPILYLVYGLLRLVNGWTFGLLPVDLFVFVVLVCSTVFTRLVSSMRTKSIKVSNQMVKQLSVLKCCDPYSESTLTRDRLMQAAKSLCTVNFDKSDILDGHRVVENSVLVSFIAYQDAKRQNGDFRQAL